MAYPGGTRTKEDPRFFTFTGTGFTSLPLSTKIAVDGYLLSLSLSLSSLCLSGKPWIISKGLEYN
jgi:hypothetical protein